jgi:hypothetical protein
VSAAEARRAWRVVCASRQAVRDARTLPERYAALCVYQGELAGFVAAHWAQLESMFGVPPVAAAANDPIAVPGRKRRRTPAEIDALVARAHELLALTPRPTKTWVAAQCGISPGYLAALLALRT